MPEVRRQRRLDHHAARREGAGEANAQATGKGARRVVVDDGEAVLRAVEGHVLPHELILRLQRQAVRSGNLFAPIESTSEITNYIKDRFG
ncbi:DNA-binding transcriptional regulator YdaS (Cro superfamily) [Chelatococcus caeni]|uniref:DNA-binding transcriptional regulator YdaS (Cro superfamily) n=1 Tax=Chelatococcus caeni TaxID=1348468 RepID=A0A840BSE3_9HYPH|nr:MULTISPECIES: hypothetical protein [Chelatococcus]MBB4015714.1 DNA-binding transcriptional regulator YdaS (Cro superfamily) [Chelatococcus caeni]